jgi:predicted nucleic acid-binding protein
LGLGEGDNVVFRVEGNRAVLARTPMMAFVDTNILVRHLTGDPPAVARRAIAFLASQPELYLADLIVAETVYVLGSFYDRLDFAEAYLVACAESAGVGTIASFDEAIDRVTTVTRMEP